MYTRIVKVGKTMNIIRELVTIIGNVLGLIVGDDFTNPASKLLEKYPRILLYW